MLVMLATCLSVTGLCGLRVRHFLSASGAVRKDAELKVGRRLAGRAGVSAPPARGWRSAARTDVGR
jgi:hypothetical protein